MKKKLLATILALCLIVSVCAPASAAASKPVTAHRVSLGEILTTGEETEGVTWAVTDGLLTVSGSGAMDNYAQGEAPWLDEEVYSIIIEDGITHLGSNAFRGMETLVSVTVGTGVRTMGESVFAENPLLTDMVIHAGQISIPANSFSGSKSLAEFWFTGDQPQFEKYSLSTGSGWVDVNYDIRNATWDSRPPANVSADGVGWGPYDLRLGESGTCGENVTWQIIYNDMPHSDSNILLISGSGAMDDMTAGEAPWLPYCTRVYTLVVGNGVTAIGANAFDGQHFSEVHIAGSVRQIGAEAFRGVTDLWSVPFTPNLRYIGDRAFADSSIGRVGQAGPMPEMGVGVYENCVKLSYLDLMEGTTVIPARTFAGCTAIKELTLPFTLTAIGDDAFAGCTGLKTVTFRGTTRQWDAIDIGSGNEALLEATLKGIISSSGTCGSDAVWVLDEDTGTLTISGTGAVTSAPWRTLKGQIKTVIVDEGITQLCGSAFRELSNATDFSLPDTLTALSDNLFTWCESLESITVPANVTTLEDSAFSYCKNLVSVELPEGLTAIGSGVFTNCTSLSQINIPAGLTKLGGDAFMGCKSLTEFAWPEAVTTVGTALHGSGIRELVIPDTVTAIGAHAFMGCTRLETVTIPDSVTSIGERAFELTSSLKSIRIPEGITTIPFSCFSGSGIAELSLPDSLTTIERYAFQRCANLESVHLPESVTSIANEVFSRCSSLAEINWPSGVDNIGWHQFNGTALTEFTVPATVKLVESYAFKDCTKLEKLVFEGKDTVVTGSQIFENDQLLTIYCWYDSPAQAAAEWSLIPYVLFDAPADLPRYQVYSTIYGDGTVTATPAESTGFEWVTIDVTAADTSVLYDLFLVYYSYEELELRTEMVDMDTFRLLMPKCDVEVVATFQNLRTGFIDIKSSDFYFDPVIWAFENGITTGISDTEFGPFGKCQRAQVVTFLWRAAGKPVATETTNPFVDVKQTDFFYDAVLWAVEKGITTGADDTHFNPYGKCSRAQVVTFLHRAQGCPEPINPENPFEDVKEKDFFYDAVLWAYENGVTTGADAAHFNPYGICNRAQVVTFLYRASSLPTPDPAAKYTFTLVCTDPTGQTGSILCENGEYAAGEIVMFDATPMPGYLAQFEATPTEELDLFYVGMGRFVLIMPEHDVNMTVTFVPAQGDYHFINTTCENGLAFALCAMDEDYRDHAKPGEFVVFTVKADDGFTLTPENISLTVGGEVYKDWWFLGELDEEELPVENVYLFEMIMPDADVDVSILCTPGTASPAQSVRIPVTVK